MAVTRGRSRSACGVATERDERALDARAAAAVAVRPSSEPSGGGVATAIELGRGRARDGPERTGRGCGRRSAPPAARARLVRSGRGQAPRAPARDRGGRRRGPAWRGRRRCARMGRAHRRLRRRGSGDLVGRDGPPGARAARRERRRCAEHGRGLAGVLEVRAPGREGGRVALSAGIAELTATADGPSLLRRAEAARRPGTAGGAGSVVVSSGDDDGARDPSEAPAGLVGVQLPEYSATG